MFRSKDKLQEDAQKFITRGQYDKALKQYQKLVERDPTDVRVLIKVGDVHHKKGDATQAIDSYQQAGDRYADRGFHQKAIAVYKRILQLDKSRVDVNFRIGQMYEEQQLLGDAVTIYEQTAEAYLRAGDNEKALSIYAHMIELDPNNVALRLQFSELLSRLGKGDLAAAHLEETAKILHDEGRTQDYIKVAERLLFSKSGDITLAQHLAEAYLSTGDHHQALAKLHVAFQSDQQNTKTLSLLGQAFEAIGKREKAANVYKEAARLHSQRSEYTECEDMLRKVLDIVPGDEKAQILLERIDKEKPKKSSLIPPKVEAPKSVAAAAKNDNSLIEVLPQDINDIEADVTGNRRLHAARASKAATKASRRPSNISVNPLAPISSKAFDALPVVDDEPHAKPPPTPDSIRPSDILEENLEMIDNLMIEARFEAAAKLIGKLEKKMPQHPLIQGKKKTLAAMREQQRLPAVAEPKLPSRKPSLGPIGNRKSVDIRPRYLTPYEGMAALQVPTEETAAAVALQAPAAPVLLEQPAQPEMDSQTATQTITETAMATKTQTRKRSQHVDTVLEDFREQIARQLDLADSQSHFDLGTAYRGMGLYKDARREFQIALNDPTRACMCYAMIGQCWMDEGIAPEAIVAFESALHCEDKGAVDELAVVFELGNAHEAAGSFDEALVCFDKIAQIDGAYREVSARIQKIQDSGMIRKFGSSDPLSAAKV